MMNILTFPLSKCKCNYSVYNINIFNRHTFGFAHFAKNFHLQSANQLRIPKKSKVILISFVVCSGGMNVSLIYLIISCHHLSRAISTLKFLG